MGIGSNVLKSIAVVARDKATPSPAVEERRRHLKRVMEENDINPTQLARRSGLQNANSLYNYFGDRSRSLSLVTLSKIIPHLPGVNADLLLGMPNAPIEPAETTKEFRKKMPLPISGSERSLRHLRASAQELKKGLAELHHTIGVWSQHLASIEARLDDLGGDSFS